MDGGSGYPPEPKAWPRKSKTSIIRLGISALLALASTILIMIVLLCGRQAYPGGSMALITIDMSRFMQYNPPTIQLVSNDTDSNNSKSRKIKLTRRMSVVAEVVNIRDGLAPEPTASPSLPSFEPRGEDLLLDPALELAERDLGSVFSTVESAIGGAASTIKSEGSKATSVIASAAAKATAEAGQLVDEIGDEISDVRAVIEQFIDKVLGTIQDDLNAWLRKVARTLSDVDVKKRYSLHITSVCAGDGVTGEPNQMDTHMNSTDVQTNCTSLFGSAMDTKFNETSNNGSIVGFQPGYTVAEVLNLFLMPESVQKTVREPIDSASNVVAKMMHGADQTVRDWTVSILWGPVVFFYALACACSGLLFFVLLGDLLMNLVKSCDLPRARTAYKILPFLGVIGLFMGSLIITVVAAVTKVIGIALGVIKIDISTGGVLQTCSWIALLLMIILTIYLHLPWTTIRKIGSTGKGGEEKGEPGLEMKGEGQKW